MVSRRCMNRVVAGMATSMFALGAAHAEPNLRVLFKSGDGHQIDFNWADVGGVPGGYGQLDGYGLWSIPGDGVSCQGWKYSGSLVGRDLPGGARDDPTAEWSLEWNLVFSDAEALGMPGSYVYVNGFVVIANQNVVSEQDYTIGVVLNTNPMPTAFQRGSIVGTVTDLTLDDAVVSAMTDSQIFTPLIDGEPEPPGFLLSDPFHASAGGPVMSGIAGPADFGIPSLVPTTQAVDQTFGIRLQFVVTPGDAVSFTSIYELTAGAFAFGDCADGNGVVGVADFLALLGQWGSSGACDIDGAGVGVTDLLTLLANWSE
jgi:hypothetical protein